MFIREITHWFARRSFQNRIFLLILFIDWPPES
ncbi:hypothetical protein, partial [Salmonella enterica]